MSVEWEKRGNVQVLKPSGYIMVPPIPPSACPSCLTHTTLSALARLQLPFPSEAPLDTHFNKISRIYELFAA